MIEGVVTDAREAVLKLLVWGPEGRQREIEAVIDTGFSGFLTVTPRLASELGLVFEGQARATLADGSQTVFSYYGVSVRWDGRERYVEAGAADTAPLVGMQLLEGHSLCMDIKDGGQVVIEAR